METPSPGCIKNRSIKQFSIHCSPSSTIIRGRDARHLSYTRTETRNGVAGKGLNSSQPLALFSYHAERGETSRESRSGGNSHLGVIALAKLHHTFLIEATGEHARRMALRDVVFMLRRFCQRAVYVRGRACIRGSLMGDAR